MTPQTNQLWKLEGQLFEMFEARDEAVNSLNCAASLDCSSDGMIALQNELLAIENGIVQFVAAQLREVDGLRAPLKALEQGVSINKADAAAATNRAIELQNRYDRLKDVIRQCMIALDQAGEWKPKESRKFESARGSFSLRVNGGAQPVEITDESLVPDSLCSADIKMSYIAWKELLALAGVEPDYASHSVVRTPRKSGIAQLLASGEAVGGCRLMPRGESLIIK